MRTRLFFWALFYVVFSTVQAYAPDVVTAAGSFVSVTNSPANTTSTNTLSQLTTFSSQTNGVAVACVQLRASSALSAVTSLIFNTSEAFTKIRHDERTGGPNWRTELWYLVNPTATTANVTMNLAGITNDEAMAFSVIYLAGIDQTNPVDAQNGNSGSGTTGSTSITTVAAEAWIVDCIIGRDDGGWAVGSGQTSRVDRQLNSGGANEGAGSSTVDGKASPGAETMDWSQGTAVDWAQSAASFTPAGTARPSRLMLLGVGG